HSAQEQAQAEYQNALANLTKTGNTVDEQHLTSLITHHLKDFEAQEHSKRALHDIDLQTKLEQSLPQIAEQAAQSAAERLINQAIASHFAMVDEKLNVMSIELSQLKSAPRAEAPAAGFDEQALFTKLETRIEKQFEQRINDRLPALVSAEASAHMASYIQASDEKFQTIKQELSAGMKSVADALAAQRAKTTPSAPAQELPKEWMQQLLKKQDEMLEQRFNAWSAQMDHHLAQSEQALLERLDDKVNALAQQSKNAAHPTQEPSASNNLLALGVAALGVVLAIAALIFK
ncbi:MAG: hypothetical protein AB7S56_09460, partial [Halothiobacillaceae bacterium]